MEPIQPNLNDEYTTHVHSNEMVNLQQTFVHYIWRNPFRRDIYEKFNFIPPPFGPPTFTDAEEVLSGQTINHPIEQIVNTNTTSFFTQLMVGGQSSFTGNLPPSWGPPQGGMFHQSYQGGTSNSNPQGGIPNTNPSELHSVQPF
jgi:hypothetical protein